MLSVNEIIVPRSDSIVPVTPNAIVKVPHASSQPNPGGDGDAESSDGGSESDYQSFPDSSDDEADADAEGSRAERDSREHERRLVLEAAGLIVKQEADARPRPRLHKRSARIAAPVRSSSTSSVSAHKELPPVPDPSPVDQVDRVDDAFERYETFKKSHGDENLKRLSVVSTTTDSLSSPPLSPSLTPSHSRDGESRGYSNLLDFLGRNKTPASDAEKSRSKLVISGPILNPSDTPARENSPAFGSVRAHLPL
jgi:hypothetical protein